MIASRHNTKFVSRAGFSLVEILVVVALLSVIILGLVAMFNQTRRAFTSSITQVDVLEAGRAATDLISREMEQMAAAGGSNNVPNFYADIQQNYLPVIQPLLDPADIRTNCIQEVYYLTQYNQQWNIIGYKVFTPQLGLGTLYRFTSTNIPSANLLSVLTTNPSPLNIFTNTVTTQLTNSLGVFSRVIDGVIDFRIRSYDTNGNLFLQTNSPSFTLLARTNLQGEYTLYQFSSNSLPANVEIELGVVEDRTLARYETLTNSDPGNVLKSGINYLVNHPGQVHIFRERIPIRNVNPAAYQ